MLIFRPIHVVVCVCVCVCVCTLIRVHLCDPMDCMQPTKLLCPWNFPGKSTEMGCHFLPQGIVPT